MPAPSRPILLALALLAGARPAPAESVQAYHGATGAQHQAHFDALSQQGYRMIALTISGAPSDLRYAAVWVQRAGPAYVAFHGVTAAGYQDLFDTWIPQGYVPVILTAAGSGGDARFAGVFEQHNTGCSGYHGLPESEFATTLQNERDNGNQIVAADVYGTSADTRYILAFAPESKGLGALRSWSHADLQEQFDALVEGHARPALIAVNDDASRMLTLWRSDDVGPVVAHAGLTAAEYQIFADTYWQQGRHPISVQASGSGSGTRYTAVWAPTDRPIARSWTATGTFVPELAAFDAWAHDWMLANEVRAASLAVVKDARLVLARGYTLAPDGYPITQPTDLFECASTSKPLTSIAMHQHFEDAQTGLDPDDAMLGFFPGITPSEPAIGAITIDHLLTHRGGWDRKAPNSFDPMINRDSWVAAALAKPLPVDKRDILRVVLEVLPLDFAPGGTVSKYSNFGFCVLGQILEERNAGLSYAEIVQRDVFDPLGITRARIGGSTFAELAPDQVFTHPYRPWADRGVMSPQRPWCSQQYGILNFPNMDAHGGWILAAPDYAKVLAAFDLGAANPLLGEVETANMWSVVPGFSTLMRGWYLRTVGDGKGGTVEMYHHAGLLFGSTALIARRADGLSFVFFANGNKVQLKTENEGEQLNDIANAVSIWPNHDLFPRVGLPSFRDRLAASVRSFGTSCGAPGAAPTLALAVAGTPEAGQAMSFELSGAPAGSLALVALGFAPTSVDLTPLGAPGCRLYTDPRATFLLPTGRAGEASIPWLVPDVPAAVGLVLFTQGAALAPAVNALGAITSHRLDVTLGGWR